MKSVKKVLPYVSVLEKAYAGVVSQEYTYTCHALKGVVKNPFATVGERCAARRLINYIARLLGSHSTSLEAWLHDTHNINAYHQDRTVRRAYRLRWIKSLIADFKADAEGVKNA